MSMERLLETAEKLVEETMKRGADQAQASAFFTDSALTRFANSQIHQNVARRVGGMIVKAVVGGGIGVARVNSVDVGLGKEAVDQALGTAKLVPPNKRFKSLPGPMEWAPIDGAFDTVTADCPPEARADAVDALISAAHSVSPFVNAVAGSFSTGMDSFAVANSLGVSAQAAYSLANLTATVISKEGGSLSFSIAGEVSRKFKDLDASSIGREAAEKSVKGLNPKKLSPGVYEAILMPLAGSVALSSVAIGFSAPAWQSGASFVRHHLGERVFDEKLNVIDEPRDPRTVVAVPIDGEGVPKRRMELVTDGVVGEDSICYDSLTAGREGKESTGHAALPVGRGFGGPSIMNAVVDPGDSTVEEMIAETRLGVLVTQFHYNAMVGMTDVMISGLTRNGTFLIEEGEVVGPVMNLRYTDSMLSALKDTPLLSKDLKRMRRITLPVIKVSKLRFTGVTEY